MSENEYLVEIQGVKKRYGKKCVLSISSLILEKGKIYGLIGDNGAGKTTLFRLLTGIDFPSEGKIIYQNKDIRKAALIEQPAIDLNLSGYDNLKYMNYLYGNKGENKIEETLRLVGLWDDRRKKVSKYSLGMKQRLGIAMSLISSPQFMLLDEPLNGVDPHGVVEFREIIKKIGDMGVTLIISSHILAELHKVASDYIFMKKGEVVKLLSLSEIEALQESKYIINTDSNEVAVNLIEKRLGNCVTVTGENKLLISSSEEMIIECIDYLREEGIRIKEQYQYHFDLEEYFKETI